MSKELVIASLQKAAECLSWAMNDTIELDVDFYRYLEEAEMFDNYEVSTFFVGSMQDNVYYLTRSVKEDEFNMVDLERVAALLMFVSRSYFNKEGL